MSFTVEYPIGTPGSSRAFHSPDMVVRFAGLAERAGVDAVAFTEHPAPSRKWLDNGGHESFDPIAALGFCAGVTSRLKLMPYLLVLPYRNPLLVAKQIATLDILSSGRLVVAVGAGYLRSEFAALGVDFEERNDLLDEAIDVLREVWETDSFEHDGRHFKAIGQVSLPAPIQRPHPPLWIGGNGRQARERAARYGQGWTPLILDEQSARTTRTPAINSPAALGVAIDDLHRRAEAAGRDPEEIAVQVQWSLSSAMDRHPGAALETLAELGAVGVTSVVVRPPAGDAERAMDLLEAYGQDVIASARPLA
jgi:probable F420-dependent oxidoreductase